MDTQLFKTTGKAAGKFTASDLVFGQEYNQNLVHQVMTSMLSNARQGNAHTKDRSEVSGTGKKPWRQKGTGRARHGSRRSPIWVGGGQAHGPRNDRNFTKKINNKMKIKALYSALSHKWSLGNIMFAEALGNIAKTKDAREIMSGFANVEGFETLNTESNPRNVCVVLSEYNADTVRALRNMPHVNVTDALNLNLLDVVRHRYIIIADAQRADEILASRHHTNETVASSTTEKAEASA